MTPTEAVLLTRYVEACCPQQRFDEYTADAWHDLLGDLTFEDCKQAAAAVARRQPFVAPAEIRAEVRAVREARIAAKPIPALDAADEEQYRRALADIRKRLGDGSAWPLAIPAGNGAEPTEEYQEHRSDDDRLRVLAQTVKCPVEGCPALPGEACLNRGAGQRMKAFHPERLSAAHDARKVGEAS